MSENRERLIAQLDSFDAARRRAALEQLAGSVRPEWRPEVNLHCHTFFSFNGYGYSPSRFAWEACDYGLAVAGIVDFDVLDGLCEFLAAGRLLGLKAVGGFESRVFVGEYRDRVINSPHEPGIFYYAGLGFTDVPEPGGRAAATLAAMTDCARRRNVAMVGLVNAHLAPVVIDYERDVLPHTPAGNATERHLLAAYEARARELMPARDDLTAFWGEKLQGPVEAIEELIDDVEKLKNLIRSRLMKYGSVGYAPPQKGNFPRLEDAVAMTLECGAVPSACWLDGTSDGEADPLAHFGFMRDKGMPTVTVIPDRNWDIEEPAERDLKVANLHRALDAAIGLEMPLMVGTEMNKHGQKFVDEFEAPALAPYRQAFVDGACVLWGHTLLRMTAGVGFTGEWADAHFGGDRTARNEFFRRVGAFPYPASGVMEELAAGDSGITPAAVLGLIEGVEPAEGRDSAEKPI